MVYTESLEQHVLELEQRLAETEHDLSKWKPKWIKTVRCKDENYEFVTTNVLYGKRYYSFGSVWLREKDRKYNLFFKKRDDEPIDNISHNKVYDTPAEAMKAFEEEILKRYA
jgi:hypothetical protein